MEHSRERSPMRAANMGVLKGDQWRTDFTVSIRVRATASFTQPSNWFNRSVC